MTRDMRVSGGAWRCGSPTKSEPRETCVAGDVRNVVCRVPWGGAHMRCTVVGAFAMLVVEAASDWEGIGDDGDIGDVGASMAVCGVDWPARSSMPSRFCPIPHKMRDTLRLPMRCKLPSRTRCGEC